MSVRYKGKKIASNDSELPAQSGNAGKFLSTDGGKTLWKTISASDAHALPNTTKYGASIVVSLNTTNYKITTILKDQNGNTLGTAQVIDLPIESVVVSGAYDSVNKKIVLTLQNGTKIDIPVGDLISGLQSEITVSNKLDADLVDDTNSTHKFVSTLAGLTGDVSISNPADGEHLVYDSVTGKWKNTASTASISWGGITGTLSNQTDLKNALDEKADISSLKTVATTGNYDDLTNKYVITYDSTNTRLVIAK